MKRNEAMAIARLSRITQRQRWKERFKIMATANFDRSIAAIWQFDGYKMDNAPGETFNTSYGITEMTWENAQENHIIPNTKPFGLMTIPDAKAIYKALYWDKCHCDDLPTGVDLMVFDFAVMAGTREAAISLQHTIFLDPDNIDGIIGPQTLKAVSQSVVEDLIEAMKHANLDYLSTLNKWWEFKNGWTRRQNYMEALAHQWNNPVVAKPVHVS